MPNNSMIRVKKDRKFSLGSPLIEVIAGGAGGMLACNVGTPQIKTIKRTWKINHVFTPTTDFS